MAFTVAPYGQYQEPCRKCPRVFVASPRVRRCRRRPPRHSGVRACVGFRRRARRRGYPSWGCWVTRCSAPWPGRSSRPPPRRAPRCATPPARYSPGSTAPLSARCARLAADGTPERRAHALEFLAARPDQRAWARQTAAADRAASVQALLARWDAADAPAEIAEEEPLPELSPLPSWSLPAADAERIANQVYEVIRQGIESYNRTLRRTVTRITPTSPSRRAAAPCTSRACSPLIARCGSTTSWKAFRHSHTTCTSQVASVFQQHGYSRSRRSS
jgi:hypothetical protein